MGLVLGIVVAIGTIVCAAGIGIRRNSLPAPSMSGLSPMPTLIGGLLIAAALIGSHYMNLSW